MTDVDKQFVPTDGPDNKFFGVSVSIYMVELVIHTVSMCMIFFVIQIFFKVLTRFVCFI